MSAISTSSHVALHLPGQQPTVMRQQAAKEQEDSAKSRQESRRKSQELDDYLDIPAFLRRQAD